MPNKSPLFKNHDIPLYLQVETLIKKWVEEGTLIPGNKLPSIRDMSKQLKVSISTIVQSYSTLEAAGVIEAKPQSGYYVAHPKEVSSQIHRPINSKFSNSPRYVSDTSLSLELSRTCSNTKLIPLGSASTHPSILPTEQLQKSLIKITKNKNIRGMHYERLRGNIDLCNEISKKTVNAGFNISPEEIQITNGCIEAINLALRACTKASDIVAIESPTFYGLMRLIENMDLKILELPTNSNTGLDLDAFEERMKKFNIKAAILTPNFLNPLGTRMSDNDKERVVQLCTKYQISLIEDDIYGEMYFDGTRPLALKSFDKKDIVFYCSSFSKTLSAGHRVGWVIPPAKYAEKVEMLKASMNSSTNSYSQMALADYLSNQNYERHLRKLRLTLKQNVSLMTKAIERYFPEGTKVSNPRGGCLLWIELAPKINSLELHERMLKKNISIIPGIAFSASDKYQNCIRMNAGVQWSAEIDSAIKQIGLDAKRLLN